MITHLKIFGQLDGTDCGMGMRRREEGSVERQWLAASREGGGGEAIR